jgi:hypothetical protein
MGFLITIREEYTDIVYLLEEKLTFTTLTDHVIPATTVNPKWAINTEPYRIPEIHKDLLVQCPGFKGQYS